MLKCGYTTGSCASAGAKASAYMLLSQNKISEIEYITPSGEKVIFKLQQQEITENYALCAIEKYSGDDPIQRHGQSLPHYGRSAETDV